MSSFADRLVGATLLRNNIYEEVELDSSAVPQALAVVLMASAASAVGGGYATGPALARGAMSALIGWLIWAAITYFVGTKILGQPQTIATWGELLRTTGFAAAPGLLNILAVIPLPFLAGLLFLVTSVWMLVAFVVAVRHALDFASTWRAVWVCIFGWVIYVVFRFLIL
jgi:hypothetical protein